MVEQLELAWNLDGCTFALREGRWDRAGMEGLLVLLRELAVEEAGDLPRRFVSLVWYLPTFLEWQLARVSDLGEAAELNSAVTAVRNEVERLLGVP